MSYLWIKTVILCVYQNNLKEDAENVQKFKSIYPATIAYIALRSSAEEGGSELDKNDVCNTCMLKLQIKWWIESVTTHIVEIVQTQGVESLSSSLDSIIPC